MQLIRHWSHWQQSHLDVLHIYNAGFTLCNLHFWVFLHSNHIIHLPSDLLNCSWFLHQALAHQECCSFFHRAKAQFSLFNGGAFGQSYNLEVYWSPRSRTDDCNKRQDWNKQDSRGPQNSLMAICNTWRCDPLNSKQLPILDSSAITEGRNCKGHFLLLLVTAIR